MLTHITSRTTLRNMVITGFFVLLGYWLLAPSSPVLAEGSRTLYPTPATCGIGAGQACRANLEWSPGALYAGLLQRRTILRVYAEPGEVILLGSSAVGIDAGAVGNPGNALIYAPGAVALAPVGAEVVPAEGTAVFNCLTQRGALGPATRGYIATRDQELAGPNNVNATTGADLGGAGYVPCHYQVPAGAGGIYSVVLYGPNGNVQDVNGGPTGSINQVAGNVDATQRSTVAYWDVTVRDANGANETIAPDNLGRLFSFYLAMFTNANGRPVFLTIYPTSLDGYTYRTSLRGSDPNGFVLYGNNIGFLDSDGATPLYRNIRGTNSALTNPLGGVTIARPQYPIFFNPPEPAVLTALGIPTIPATPAISNVTFMGTAPGYTNVGDGGDFSFTSNIPATYEIVISRDGIDFDPTLPTNRVLRGTRPAGVNTIPWDGNDNTGAPFPVSPGTPPFAYPFRAMIRAGEYHFPLLDVENNRLGTPGGGPTLELINPPDITGDGVADCPNYPAGCFNAFYDDRGYRSGNGTVLGTINGDLCPLVAGNSNDNDPLVLYSGPNGYDTRTNQRAFGFNNGGNPGADCAVNGGFGDAKGLDQWTFYPSNVVQASLVILATGQLPPTPTPPPPAPATPTPVPAPGGNGSSNNPEPGQPGTVGTVGEPFCLTAAGRTAPQCQGTALAQVSALPATGESPWSKWRPVIFGAGFGTVTLLALGLLLWRRKQVAA